MMLELYLMLTGRKRYLVMVSATQDAAVRLLAPYRANLEVNGRIRQFYGDQAGAIKWEEDHFVTKTGLTFLAIGFGNAPRGARNENVRPDIIDIQPSESRSTHQASGKINGSDARSIADKYRNM